MKSTDVGVEAEKVVVEDAVAETASETASETQAETKTSGNDDFEARATIVRDALEKLMEENEVSLTAELRYLPQGIITVPVFADKKQAPKSE